MLCAKPLGILNSAKCHFGSTQRISCAHKVRIVSLKMKACMLTPAGEHDHQIIISFLAVTEYTVSNLFGFRRQHRDVVASPVCITLACCKPLGNVQHSTCKRRVHGTIPAGILPFVCFLSRRIDRVINDQFGNLAEGRSLNRTHSLRQGNFADMDFRECTSADDFYSWGKDQCFHIIASTECFLTHLGNPGGRQINGCQCGTIGKCICANDL